MSTAETELTAREIDVLRRLASGATYAAIARSLGISDRTACWIGQQIMRKLEARNITHAVFLACQAQILRQQRRHGDRPGYLQHMRRGEEACDPCKEAAARHSAERRAARRRASTTAARRLQPQRARGRT